MEIGSVDVAVIGGGPIGRWLAAGLLRRGVSVRCIDKAADAPWYPNFGIWQDDAVALGIDDALERVFPAARFIGPSGSISDLARAYAMVDRSALRDRLDADLGAGCLLHDEVVGADDRDRVTLRLASGRSLTATVVLDARGRPSPLATYRSAADPAWQTAWGAEIEVRAGIDPDQLVLMDWSYRFDDGGPPGFLYAVPRGNGVLFVEETVLAARPAFAVGLLRKRLEERLAARGVAYRWTGQGEEHCRIPMGAALPRRGGRIVPFGAAAGMIHPASGYLLGHGLRFAEGAAVQIAASLHAGHDPVHAAWESAWPADRVRMWRLYSHGLTVLLGLSHNDLGMFFDTFFRLPPDRWADFLSARGTSATLAATMLAYARIAPWSIRRRLLG